MTRAARLGLIVYCAAFWGAVAWLFWSIVK